MATRAVALPGSTGAIQTSAGSGPITYMGFTVRETAGAVAVMRIRETNASGLILETISLVANESSGDWYGPQGVICNSNVLFYQLVSGAIEGSIRVQ